MSIHQMAHRVANEFEHYILDFAGRFKTRRVYVLTYNKDAVCRLEVFRLDFYYKAFTYDDRWMAFDMARFAKKEMGIHAVTVQIYDFKKLVDMSYNEIESTKHSPCYRDAKFLWDTFHECCCCKRIAPIVRDCLWAGKKSRICEDCFMKYTINYMHKKEKRNEKV